MIYPVKKYTNYNNNMLKNSAINTNIANNSNIINKAFNALILKEKIINDNTYIKKSIGGSKDKIIENLLSCNNILKFSRSNNETAFICPEEIDFISQNDTILTIFPINLNPSSQKDKDAKWEVFSSDSSDRNIEVFFNLSYYYGVTVSKAEIFVSEKIGNKYIDDNSSNLGGYYYDSVPYELYKNSESFCSKVLDTTCDLVTQLMTNSTKNLIY